MGTVIGCSQGLAMQNILSALLLSSAAVHLSQGQKSSLLWREDGRCGEKFPLPNGKPGQCDPEGDGPRKGPCCSPKGFCGNTLKHCECETCIDYNWEQFAEEPVKETQQLKKKEMVTKPETDELTPELSIVVNDSGLDDSQTETVQTRVGKIKGKRINTDGFTHYTFFGIPYAQPPVGSLRFKAPLPVRPWTKSLEAFEKGPRCIQKNEFLPGVNADYSEDCLHLNIYTEDLKTTAKPVMIWIHGGSFTLGSGNDYAPLDALLKEGVIVVTINYRLSSLGFLTFGNDLVSGNMGLQDQALAIQWVKQNIHNFGGNPHKITIFGESAGGVSVHAQVLSPWNFGQIQGAIAQSGTMLIYNQIKSYGPREEHFAKHAAEKFGCADGLDQNTLECLQNVDIKDINEKLSATANDNFNQVSAFEWRPVVDNYASTPFLPLDPLEAMQTGVYNQIPFMSGTVKNDGAILIPIFKSLDNWGSRGPAIMFSSPTYNATSEDALFANITMKYYNHPEGDSALAIDQPIMDLVSDVVFLLEIYGRKLQLSEEESALSTRMVKYWTNFAKFGHPTPSSEDLPFWASVSQDANNYMELKAAPEMKQDLEAERMHFWEKMLWTPKQEAIERRVVYTKATEFLLSNTR